VTAFHFKNITRLEYNRGIELDAVALELSML